MDLTLPQGQFIWDVDADSLVVLVAGGRAPTPDWLRRVAALYPVWAVDRGVEICRDAAVRPEILFGDADSGSGEAWKWAETLAIPVERYRPDKDRTDLQLALEAVSFRRKSAATLLAGGMGRRFDHAFSNIYSLVEMTRTGMPSLGMADESEVLLLLQAGQTLQADFIQNPQIVSLLPLSPICSGVCSRGVHWPLERATLRMDAPSGMSNRLAVGSRKVKVSLDSGCLGVYFCWEENGL